MKLLFICTHNRCRSILAEAIANQYGAGKITAASAGSSPQGKVHPLSLKFLGEHGVDIQGLSSQSWDEFEQFSPDAILTLCDSAAAETCPVWFDSSVLVHWGMQDPSKNQGDEDVQRTAFNHTIAVLQARIEMMLEHGVDQLGGAELEQALNDIAAQVN